jgi:hypothetical protein
MLIDRKKFTQRLLTKSINIKIHVFIIPWKRKYNCIHFLSTHLGLVAFN